MSEETEEFDELEPKQTAASSEKRQAHQESAKESSEARQLYEDAMSVLRRSRSRLHRQAAISKLEQASELGNDEALAQLGFVALFGEDEMYANDWQRFTTNGARKRLQNVTLAFELFERTAQRGVAAGQLGLAFMYSVGLAPGGASQSRAIVYLTFAALGGDQEAQTALAYRYWAGVSVEQSCEMALTYYSLAAARVAEHVSLIGSAAQAAGVQRVRLVDEFETAGLAAVNVASAGGGAATLDEELIEYHLFLAERGDVTAQVALGQLFYFGGRGLEQDFERAAQYFQRAAEQGNALASAHLAKMFLEGTAERQDNSTAYSLFLQAAEKGHPFGHTGIGLMHLLGVGVPQDFNKALKHLNTAVEHGWAEGYLQLGLMYYRGLGVRRDIKQAVKLFTTAAQNGNLLAIYNLAQLHAHGSIGLVRNCRTATELFKNVAERGSANALFEQAFAAYQFEASSNDPAVVRYLFLAELGYELAQSNAAFILERGETRLFKSAPPEESQDAQNSPNWSLYRLANTYWYRSALQGSGIARLKLGDYHYYGLGVESDFELAAAQYQIAADQHHIAQAMFNLGLMHHFGVGMKADEHLAKRYYDQAAETSVDAALPVALALARLNTWLLYESITSSSLRLLLSPSELASAFRNALSMPRLKQTLGKDWDSYALLLLLAIVCILVVARRFAHLQQQHAQLHQGAAAPVAPVAPENPAPQ